MKTMIVLLILVWFLALSANSHSSETCVTKTFGGKTTTVCKEDGQVVSKCVSREFAGKIITHCQ